MSLVEEVYDPREAQSRRKERLIRLGVITPPAPVVPRKVFDMQTEDLQDLRAHAERQKAIISDLKATVAKQRKIIREFSDENQSPTPRIADVAAVVAKHFNMTKQMIIGHVRTSAIAFPRQIGYYICRELGYSWLAIGRGFQKDHSSAVHGAARITERLLADPELVEQIETINIAIEKYVTHRIETAKAVLR